MLDILVFIVRMLFVLVLILSAPFIGGYLAGGWGVLIGLMFSCAIYATALNVKKKADYPQTSICLKCGGIGRFTASDGRYTGFKCEKCKHFWKVKIKYY